MKSRLLTNMLLLAVVVVLGYVIFSTESDQGTQLSTIESDNIIAIEIQHRDRYTVLKKQNDRWQMTRPINIAANDFRINNVLKLINSESAARYPVSETDLRRFKLDEPRTSIHFTTDTDAIRFDFGNANPINRLRYVRVNDYVHLIDDHLYPLISSQLGTLISPSLFHESSEIIRLQIPGYRFERDGVNWALTPEISDYSSDDINSFIDSWQNARAFGVHDYVEREHLGDIELNLLLDGLTLNDSLVITDTDPWLIIARPSIGIEYHFDISSYDTLLNPMSEQDQAILDAEEAIVKHR